MSYGQEQELLGESQNTAGDCHQAQERPWLQVGQSEPRDITMTHCPTSQRCLSLAVGTNAEVRGLGSIPPPVVISAVGASAVPAQGRQTPRRCCLQVPSPLRLAHPRSTAPWGPQ